jgi:hypothetical protein
MTTSSIGSFIFAPNGQTKESSRPEISLDVSRSDEIRVREYIAHLKATRASIQSTVVSDLESLHSISELGTNNDDRSQKKQISISEARTADLEMAVLVQVSFEKSSFYLFILSNVKRFKSTSKN